MIRLILARALGVLLFGLAFTLVWEVIEGARYARGFGEIALLVFQALAAPFAALAGYWLWKRDRRAVTITGIACAIGSIAGTLAAWTYAPPPEKSSAAFGALGGGAVFTIAMVLLAHLALRNPAPAESVPPS